MGNFILPTKDGKFVPREELSAEDLVKAAVSNLNLWLEHPDQSYDYLISTFALSMLNDAMRKLHHDTIRDVQDVSSA